MIPFHIYYLLLKIQAKWFKFKRIVSDFHFWPFFQKSHSFWQPSKAYFFTHVFFSASKGSVTQKSKDWTSCILSNIISRNLNILHSIFWIHIPEGNSHVACMSTQFSINFHVWGRITINQQIFVTFPLTNNFQKLYIERVFSINFISLANEKPFHMM